VGYTRALRRVSVGPFPGAAMVTLDALKAASAESLDDYLQPVDAALADWPTASMACAMNEPSRSQQYGYCEKEGLAR